MKILLSLLFIATTSACTTFSTDKVLKVRQGMTSQDIIKMFGKPRNVSQAVCGSSVGEPWTCTTWEYGYSEMGESAKFTFSGESENLILNSFSFNR